MGTARIFRDVLKAGTALRSDSGSLGYVKTSNVVPENFRRSSAMLGDMFNKITSYNNKNKKYAEPFR
jgi:hypothetical protein